MPLHLTLRPFTLAIVNFTIPTVPYPLYHTHCCTCTYVHEKIFILANQVQARLCPLKAVAMSHTHIIIEEQCTCNYRL